MSRREVDWIEWFVTGQLIILVYVIGFIYFYGILNWNLLDAERAKLGLTYATQHKDLKEMEVKYVSLVNKLADTEDNLRWVRKKLTKDRDTCIDILREKFNVKLDK